MGIAMSGKRTQLYSGRCSIKGDGVSLFGKQHAMIYSDGSGEFADPGGIFAQNRKWSQTQGQIFERFKVIVHAFIDIDKLMEHHEGKLTYLLPFGKSSNDGLKAFSYIGPIQNNKKYFGEITLDQLYTPDLIKYLQDKQTSIKASTKKYWALTGFFLADMSSNADRRKRGRSGVTFMWGPG